MCSDQWILNPIAIFQYFVDGVDGVPCMQLTSPQRQVPGRLAHTLPKRSMHQAEDSPFSEGSHPV